MYLILFIRTSLVRSWSEGTVPHLCLCFQFRLLLDPLLFRIMIVYLSALKIVDNRLESTVNQLPSQIILLILREHLRLGLRQLRKRISLFSYALRDLIYVWILLLLSKLRLDSKRNIESIKDIAFCC